MSCVVSKCEKIVFINDVKIIALVDSGSDLTLIREEQYKKIGSPPLSRRQIQFRGAGSGRFDTWGEINVNLIIDGDVYPIIAHVVPDGVVQNDLILGTDFLRTVELNIKKGVVSISKLQDSECDLPEVLKINIIENNELDLSHIKDKDVKNRVIDLIVNYSPEKIKDTGVEMRIVLMDDIPVYERPRRFADSEDKDVETQIRKWYEAGIIRFSTSDFSSRVVPVPRKNGPVRVCVDYRKVNAKTVKVRFPAPIIEDQLDKLQGAKIYSTMDMENGFLHVVIEEGSRKYTAFSVPSGHYEFTRAPFGFCNSPAYFFRYVQAVFCELIQKGIVVVYIDDFVIPSDTIEEGVEKLAIVLKVASEYGLKFNWHKCQFLKEKITYLGHVVESGKVSPSEDKTNAVKHFPKPNNVKAVQSFLGLTGYFRKFIPRYAFIARPLSDLLRKENEFQFGELQEKAIREKIKNGEIVDGYHISRGLLMINIQGEDLIVVPKLMQTSLIRKIHESGHFASARTIQLLKDEYWFHNMQAQVEKVIRNCLVCILAERKSGKKDGFLHPIQKEAPLDTYHVDHIGPMPSTRKSFRHILVVIDAFTKFVWFYPTKSTTSAEVVDRLTKQALVFGNPRVIISDKGTAFTSQEFQDYCQRENIQHHSIVTGIPRGNGQVERVNKTLIPMMTKLSMPNAEQWYKYVGLAQQYYNHAPCRSTGYSAFFLQFGVKMRLKEDLRVQEILEEETL